jgi:hypothetical protein
MDLQEVGWGAWTYFLVDVIYLFSLIINFTNPKKGIAMGSPTSGLVAEIFSSTMSNPL